MKQTRREEIIKMRLILAVVLMVLCGSWGSTDSLDSYIDTQPCFTDSECAAYYGIEDVEAYILDLKEGEQK